MPCYEVSKRSSFFIYIYEIIPSFENSVDSDHMVSDVMMPADKHPLVVHSCNRYMFIIIKLLIYEHL